MNKVSSSIIYMQPGGVKQVDGQFLSTAELHLSSSLGEGDSMGLPTQQQQQQQQTPFWEDLEPFQPVTAKAYWRHTDVPSIACYHATPRAMWKLDHEHQELLPEVDVVLTCADVFGLSLETSKLHGIWATKRKYRVIDAHGNVPPQHLILYPPGVFPQEEQDMVVARGKWSFPVKSPLAWPPLTQKAKAHLRQYGNLPQWSPTSTEFTPKTATVFTEDTDWSQPKKSDVSGVWKIEDEDIWYPQYVLVYPMEAKLDEEHDTIGFWGLEESAKPNPENGSWNPKHVWFLPPGKALKGLRVCGQWAYSPTQPNGTWPALTIVTNKTIMSDTTPASKDEASPSQSTRQQQETREEEKEQDEPSESSETSGMSNTSFLSRNSAAAAAIRKKREIEQRFSGTSLQEMAEATKRRSSLGESARSQKALLKKRILERRYSSISSRQEATARKSPAPRYSFSETLRLSETTKSMLEASSALIASLQVSPSSPLPPPVEESPIAPRKTATVVEPSISKVQLMEALLAEQGSLLVLCTESPDSKTMSLDQDNALLLCYDVPEYEILYIENEPTLGKELLQVSKKSIFPQFFFEPLLQDDSDDDDEEEGSGEEPKYVYLGGFATVRAILAERMSSQYRTSEMEERRKGRRRRLTRSKSNDV